MLGTTNDGGGTMLPAEVKIIVGDPHTCRGWGGNAGSITLIRVSTPVLQGSSRTVSSGQFLEGSLGGLILAVTHSSQLSKTV